MISDRPFATLSLTEIGKLIPAYIKADSVEFLHDLQLEVYLRDTPDAEKLFQRIEKCLKCFEVPWHFLAFGK